MKTVSALALFVLSLAAMAKTTASTQQINLQLFIPCVNHGKGEIVNLSGRVRVLTSRYPDNGLEHGFSGYAGTLTGKGTTTGHPYRAEGSNDASYKNVVFHQNGGGDGDFTFTSNLYLRDLFYEDNGIMYHNQREVIVSNEGTTLNEAPEIMTCQ